MCLLTHWLAMPSIVFKIARIYYSKFKCNYLKNEKLFLNFLSHFWNLHQILNVFKEKMIVIGNVFPKLETVKNLVRTLSKRHGFRACFECQLGRACEILAKSPWERFSHVFSSISGNLIWKISPLVFREILRVFVNTLTGDAKYSV